MIKNDVNYTNIINKTLKLYLDRRRTNKINYRRRSQRTEKDIFYIG